MAVWNEHADVQSEGDEKQDDESDDHVFSVKEEDPGQIQAHVDHETGEECPGKEGGVTVQGAGGRLPEQVDDGVDDPDRLPHVDHPPDTEHPSSGGNIYLVLIGNSTRAVFENPCRKKKCLFFLNV